MLAIGRGDEGEYEVPLLVRRTPRSRAFHDLPCPELPGRFVARSRAPRTDVRKPRLHDELATHQVIHRPGREHIDTVRKRGGYLVAHPRRLADPLLPSGIEREQREETRRVLLRVLRRQGS